MPWLLSLFACTPAEDACAPELPAGEAAATVDGADFTSSDATWQFAGAAVQLNASGADGAALSFVLQTTSTGESLDVAVAPFSVDLSDAGGGWITYYPDTGDSLTTQAGSGTLEVVAFEDTLSACFSGVLGDDAGTALDLAGELVASEAR
jgi:hypothetical protein